MVEANIPPEAGKYETWEGRTPEDATKLVKGDVALLRQFAKDLGTYGSDLQTDVKNVLAKVSTTGADGKVKWSGEGATAFLDLLKKNLLPGVDKTVNTQQNLSTVIGKWADSVEDNQEGAKRSLQKGSQAYTSWHAIKVGVDAGGDKDADGTVREGYEKTMDEAAGEIKGWIAALSSNALQYLPHIDDAAQGKASTFQTLTGDTGQGQGDQGQGDQGQGDQGQGDDEPLDPDDYWEPGFNSSQRYPGDDRGDHDDGDSGSTD